MHTYIISPISPAQGDTAPACCLCLHHPSRSPGLLHYCVSVDAGDDSAAVDVATSHKFPLHAGYYLYLYQYHTHL